MSRPIPSAPNAVGPDKFFHVANIENGIRAHAGGGSTNAYQLTGQASVITVVANDGDSVKLPRITPAPGMVSSVLALVWVFNDTVSNTLTVYGSGADTVDHGAFISLAPTTSCWLMATSYDPSTGSGTWMTSQSGAAGLAIGDPVVSSTPHSVLFVDGSGNLAQDAGFAFDSSAGLALSQDAVFGGNVTLSSLSGVGTRAIAVDASGKIVLL